MKKKFICVPAVFCFLLLFSFENTEAQFLKKLKNEVKSRAENKIINKAGNATDRAIDNTADAATQKKNTDETVVANTQSPSTDANVAESKNSKPTIANYKNYDFVPGDKIIFQPDLSAEPDAELPARFSIKAGNAEIQTFEGEKIIHLQEDGYATIAPLMSSEKYLPEQFTLEFDMMLENDASYFKHVSYFYVNFRKKEDQNYRGSPLFKFVMYGVSAGAFGDQNAGRIAFSKNVEESFGSGNTWHHIAIYVRKNIGKVYIDQNRVIATNNLTVGADKVDIQADRYGIKIKNFRLAAGGDDKYNKVITDGKFITRGILFDVNKSTIKPESMGTLNEIVKLMKDHADLKFEIDGHTDSDGNADANMKLSKNRADAVKSKLVEMGIADERLTTKGLGATQPVDKNDSAEGKANNRRVEFIKI